MTSSTVNLMAKGSIWVGVNNSLAQWQNHPQIFRGGKLWTISHHLSRTGSSEMKHTRQETILGSAWSLCSQSEDQSVKSCANSERTEMVHSGLECVQKIFFSDMVFLRVFRQIPLLNYVNWQLLRYFDSSLQWQRGWKTDWAIKQFILYVCMEVVILLLTEFI